ncbi:hypothetical protein AXG93_3633s1030 [Marchantia polymorpha subsp. ruderalis]|uniref:Uncharacterized protein n=1 Tax=Marchantia polymorpha subsp. ruderalis TaxID=1480154 RepID=A0A176W625_MARPO|nr:hypothetical protein AXG93_3633s1030 [Marchantia polymorpha subsp. ruderalis]
MSSVVMKRLPFGVALARGSVRAQQARRLVVQAERAAIMRHSRDVSQLKPETVKKIQENIGNLSMIFDFDGTLVAAGAGLGEKEGHLMSSLMNVLEGGVDFFHQLKSITHYLSAKPDQNLSLVVKNGGFAVKFTDEYCRLAKGVDVDAVIEFVHSLVVGSKELNGIETF